MTCGSDYAKAPCTTNKKITSPDSRKRYHYAKPVLTSLPFSRLEFAPCKQALGSKYGKAEICEEQSVDVRSAGIEYMPAP